MPITVRNLEWLNHNSQRAYPVAADSTRKDVSNTFKLPDDFIVGLTLPIHWGMNVDPGKFFIRKIASFSTGFSITVGYSGESDIDVASALIARAAHTKNQVYNLGGIGDFVDSRGNVIIGSLDGIDAQPSGLFTFDLEGTRLEIDTIRPHIRGVMSLQVQNGNELSSLLYGRVRIQAGKNARLRVEQEMDQDPKIIVDAIEGAGLIDDCVCSEQADPVRTINGIASDINGNFNLLGNDCLNIVSGTHALELRDTCSEACCGCKELEAVTTALEAFGDKATTLENFLVSLEARVTQMDLVVLGSRIGDRGCTIC